MDIALTVVEGTGIALVVVAVAEGTGIAPAVALAVLVVVQVVVDTAPVVAEFAVVALAEQKQQYV